MIFKVCSKCNLEKDISLFYTKKTSKDGKQGFCKECAKKSHREYTRKNHTKVRQYWNTWHKENRAKYPEKVRRQTQHAAFKHNFGITLEVYEDMVKVQNNLCGICNKPESRKNRVLSVDHNHTTGKVRKLLCHRCNAGLGFFFENTVIMENAIEYIRTHNG